MHLDLQFNCQIISLTFHNSNFESRGSIVVESVKLTSVVLTLKLDLIDIVEENDSNNGNTMLDRRGD